MPYFPTPVRRLLPPPTATTTSPHVACVQSPNSDRYKAAGADVVYRDVNRAQSVAFSPSDVLPLTIAIAGLDPSDSARPFMANIPPLLVPLPGNNITF